LLAYWKLIRKAKLRSLGFGSEGWAGELLFAAKMLIVGAGVYLVAGTIFWLGLHLFMDDATASFKEHLRNAVFRDESAGRIFAVVILYPVLEELWYRGLLYTPMRQQMGRSAAIILVSLLFAFAHGWVPVNQFIGGLLFVWAYEKRRSLFVPIVLHIAGNGILVLFGWALKNLPAFAAWIE
jgi:membrane protease YdiL (CAAX protease family)